MMDDIQSVKANNTPEINVPSNNPVALEPQQVDCVDNSVKCKSCGKSKDDSVRIAHNHLMEKCNLLRDIVSISHNDRSADPNRDLKDESAKKLKALIAEF